MSNLKLEVGKKYVDHVGEVFGPMEPSGDLTYPFRCSVVGRIFTSEGHYYSSSLSGMDLVAEYVEPLPEETLGKENTMQLQPMTTAPKDRWIMICTYKTEDGSDPSNLVLSHWSVWDDRFLSNEKDELPHNLGWMEVPKLPKENTNAQD